jgi:hypothetical protein
VSEELLPSWREGEARAEIVEFLARAEEIPPDERLAAFDNDGTPWCEKPRYPQLDFFIRELRRAVEERPGLRRIPEFDALLAGDGETLASFGLERVAVRDDWLAIFPED